MSVIIFQASATKIWHSKNCKISYYMHTCIHVQPCIRILSCRKGPQYLLTQQPASVACLCLVLWAVSLSVQDCTLVLMCYKSNPLTINKNLTFWSHITQKLLSFCIWILPLSRDHLRCCRLISTHTRWLEVSFIGGNRCTEHWRLLTESDTTSSCGWEPHQWETASVLAVESLQVWSPLGDMEMDLPIFLPIAHKTLTHTVTHRGFCVVLQQQYH